MDGNIVKARAKALRQVGAAEKTKHLQKRVGETDTALFEETGMGRLPDFSLIKVDNPATAGSLAPVKITGASNDYLMGQIIG